MNKRRDLAVLIMLVLRITFFTALPASALSQDSPAAQASTRTELIEAQQKDKAQRLQPAKPSKAERWLEKYVGDHPLNKYLGGIPGLDLRLGGLSGSGFSMGAEYSKPDLAKGQISFRASAVGSTKLWSLIETELRFPHFAGRRLDMDFRGRRLDANSVDYYGPGPNSNKAAHTNYRREENSLDFHLAFKPTQRYLRIGLTAGYLWFNVGPGKSSIFASSETVYSPSLAPGIDRQAYYLSTGAFLEVDSRDKPKDPHAGTHFIVKLNKFNDRKYDQYSFQQIDSSIEQCLSFFNGKRVIALRARSVLSYPDNGNAVPFYMQPTLGGTSDLRGYRRYRFYDDNSFLMTAEYRWEIFTLLDAAIFADAGKVFHQDRDFNLEKLEGDVGFGLRFKTVSRWCFVSTPLLAAIKDWDCGSHSIMFFNCYRRIAILGERRRY
jgi:outer membrane protein assembly factor BamA